jgi:hypothetical protein
MRAVRDSFVLSLPKDEEVVVGINAGRRTLLEMGSLEFCPTSALDPLPCFGQHSVDLL